MLPLGSAALWKVVRVCSARGSLLSEADNGTNSTNNQKECMPDCKYESVSALTEIRFSREETALLNRCTVNDDRRNTFVEISWRIISPI